MAGAAGISSRTSLFFAENSLISSAVMAHVHSVMAFLLVFCPGRVLLMFSPGSLVLPPAQVGLFFAVDT